MESDFRLIITIVNRGFAEGVIQASRQVGARGGTIVRGRGSSTAVTYFKGLALEPEKELVWIVAKKENASEIAAAIYEKVGLSTPGAGISFILPVENLIGINLDNVDHSPQLEKEETKEEEKKVVEIKENVPE